MTHERHLFTPLTIREVTFKNRIWISPMCQYSSKEGHPTDWHFIHLGSRAVGGAGLVMVEATAVAPEGRISPHDSGMWSDDHILSFKRITDFIKAQGAICGIQIAHAGRKASTAAPWVGGQALSKAEGGWQTIAPSPIPFKEGDPTPHEMNSVDIEKTIQDFVTATKRCLKAGFEVLELHMAHGYLMHEFLSPISNQRDDEYGGTLENRMRFPLQIAAAVREKWPHHLPLFVRISATDWVEGPENNAWTLGQSIVFSRELKKLGIDLIDCSSGAILPSVTIPLGPGYQVQFAEAIKKEADTMTAAVGLITEPIQAETILLQHQADAIFIARESLRNPYWPVHAARALGVRIERPDQYGRA
jgi:2,4-dienoyl-CoA reductase-like NADH-dependent reductase (Old Yellow Enzyme family)